VARVGLQRFLRLGFVKLGPFFFSFGPASSDFGMAKAEGLSRRVLVDITFGFMGRESRHEQSGTRQCPWPTLSQMTLFLAFDSYPQLASAAKSFISEIRASFGELERLLGFK